MALNAPRWREASFLQGLGGAFGTDLPPQPLSEPHWVARSERLAQDLGLADWLDSEDALARLSGAGVDPATRAHASVYSGTSSASGPASSVTGGR